MIDLSLDKLAAMIEWTGKALIALAGLATLAAFWAAIDGPWVAGIVGAVYALALGAAGILVMAFGKIIPILVQIEANTRRPI